MTECGQLLPHRPIKLLAKPDETTLMTEPKGVIAIGNNSGNIAIFFDLKAKNQEN